MRIANGAGCVLLNGCSWCRVGSSAGLNRRGVAIGPEPPAIVTGRVGDAFLSIVCAIAGGGFFRDPTCFFLFDYDIPA